MEIHLSTTYPSNSGSPLFSWSQVSIVIFYLNLEFNVTRGLFLPSRNKLVWLEVYLILSFIVPFFM